MNVIVAALAGTVLVALIIDLPLVSLGLVFAGLLLHMVALKLW